MVLCSLFVLINSIFRSDINWNRCAAQLLKETGGLFRELVFCLFSSKTPELKAEKGQLANLVITAYQDDAMSRHTEKIRKFIEKQHTTLFQHIDLKSPDEDKVINKQLDWQTTCKIVRYVWMNKPIEWDTLDIPWRDSGNFVLNKATRNAVFSCPAIRPAIVNLVRTARMADILDTLVEFCAFSCSSQS